MYIAVYPICDNNSNNKNYGILCFYFKLIAFKHIMNINVRLFFLNIYMGICDSLAFLVNDDGKTLSFASYGTSKWAQTLIEIHLDFCIDNLTQIICRLRLCMCVLSVVYVLHIRQ